MEAPAAAAAAPAKPAISDVPAAGNGAAPVASQVAPPAQRAGGNGAAPVQTPAAAARPVGTPSAAPAATAEKGKSDEDWWTE
jgi:hypothetical protein